MLDSGSSVSLIDKGSVPKQCIVSGQLQTADGHKLTVMGTVKAHLQLEQFSTEHGQRSYIDLWHGFLVTRDHI